MRTKTGVLKTGSVRRKNFHERWTAEQMDVLEGTPWKLNPEADEAEAVLPSVDDQHLHARQGCYEKTKIPGARNCAKKSDDHSVCRWAVRTISLLHGLPFPLRRWELTSAHQRLQDSTHHAHGRDAACARKVLVSGGHVDYFWEKLTRETGAK